VLIEIAVDLRVTRCVELAFGFAAAVEEAVGARPLVIGLPPGRLARFAKADEVTHPLPSIVTGFLLMVRSGLRFVLQREMRPYRGKQLQALVACEENAHIGQ
jgi:hypothetical protein